jgi:hypothetical protein
MAKTLFTALISLVVFTRAVAATPASAQETAGQILAKLENSRRLCGSPQRRETKRTGAIRKGEFSRRSRLYWSDLGRDRQRLSQRIHRRSVDRGIAATN